MKQSLINIAKYLDKPYYNEIPLTFYHYTSCEGLKGILESKSLWATKIHYLNDSEEYVLALEIASKTLCQLNHLNKDADLKKLLSEMERHLERIETPNIFVLSFSPKKDQLSQWRGYCPSGGYSIGFSADTLLHCAGSQNFNLFPCLYDTNEQEKLIMQIIQDHINLFKTQKQNTRKHDSESLIEPISESFSVTLYNIAPIIKNSAFSEEEEWRIFSRPINKNNKNNKNINFRVKNNLLIPYFNFSLRDAQEQFTVTRIVVGPMPYQELAFNSLGDFLAKNDIYCNVSLTSETPYRFL